MRSVGRLTSLACVPREPDVEGVADALRPARLDRTRWRCRTGIGPRRGSALLGRDLTRVEERRTFFARPREGEGDDRRWGTG